MTKIYVVDAFTDQAYTGNPAAVVLLAEAKSDDWMRAVAAEMKHSETAFVDSVPPDGSLRSLRWFTPEVEMDLCGHATLATTHVLGGEQRFQTRSGELNCNVTDDGWIQMDFPIDHPVPAVGLDIGQALPGIDAQAVLRGRDDVLVVVPSEDDVRTFIPDFELIKAVSARGIILTAAATETDFVTRFFAPLVGVNEDPVTGSAHTTLASYWGSRLNKRELVSRQVSHRPGTVRMSVNGERVLIKGQAITVLEGELQY